MDPARGSLCGVPTPFAYLNGLLGGGLRGGKLYVLGAPPGGGKTTLAAQLSDTAAEAGIPTAFVAFEMGRGQLFDYALARAAGLNSAIIEARSFRRSEEDQAGLVGAANGYLEAVAPNLSVIEGTTVYGMAYLDLNTNGPMVVEVPPSPFLGSLLDLWQVPLSGIDSNGGARHWGRFSLPGWFGESAQPIRLWRRLRRLLAGPNHSISSAPGS
jgi:hypothetical protein